MSKKTRAEREFQFETKQLHVGQEAADPVTDARAVPIYLTSSYVFHNSKHAADRFGLRDAGNIYGRLTNSTQDVFEKRIAALEGGSAALALASGAAAITYTIEALAANGGHIVAQKTIYGGSYNLLAHTLPQYGIRTFLFRVEHRDVMNLLCIQQVIDRINFSPRLACDVFRKELEVVEHNHLNEGVLKELVVHVVMDHAVNLAL